MGARATSTESVRRWVEKHHGSYRNYKLREKYRIDEDDFDDMLRAQGGDCALCRIAPGTQVDHDHVTGRIRGILCLNCNAAMGAFNDNPDEIQAAIEYLEGSR